MRGASPLIAVEPNEAKRETALRMGATHAVDPANESVVERVREITGGRGADHVIDFVAIDATLKTSWAMARRGGQVTVLGLPDTTTAMTIPVLELVSSARTVVGSYFGMSNPRRDLPDMVELIETGRMRADFLVSETRKLDEINEVVDALKRGTDIVRSVIVY